MSVGFVWRVEMLSFLKSLFRLVFFSMYVLNTFVPFVRIRIFPVFQLINGLFSLNQGNPKMISEDPMLLTSNRSRCFRPLISV